MDVSIPIYVETLRTNEGAVYSCRPLFFNIQSKNDALLSRAITRFSKLGCNAISGSKVALDTTSRNI